MTAFAALLRDTLAEASDKRGLLVLTVLGLMVVLALGSLSFTVAGAEAMLADRLARINEMSLSGVRNSMTVRHAVPAVPESGEVGEEPSFSAAVAGGVYGVVRFEDGSQASLLPAAWERFLDSQGIVTPAPPEPSGESGAAYWQALDARVEWFLRDRMERFGYEAVEVRTIAGITDGAYDDPGLWRIAVRVDPLHGEGPKDIHVLFGLLEFDARHLSVAETVLDIQETVANTLTGFLGVLVFVSIFAGFMPSLLEKGTLDLHLARPVTRGGLFLGKYAAAVLLVLVYTTALFTASWLALRLATGFGSPWSILCALTVTAIFAVLHAVSACFGVLTRSGGPASLTAFAVWGASSLASSLHGALEMESSATSSWPVALREAVVWGHRVLPPIRELAAANATLLAKTTLSERLWEKRYAGRLEETEWLEVLGASGVFAALFLALGIWLLDRRDG